MSKIPRKILKAILEDTKYKFCALHGYHTCEGSITLEHALIYAGKQIQEKWAIISLCERGHAVGRFQDAGTLNKEMNVWVALNQATRMELDKYSKGFPLSFTLGRLNAKYGVYEPRFDVSNASLINYP